VLSQSNARCRSTLHPQLANVLSSEALFYTCIIPFIIFFGSFAAILYPLRESLHPTGTRVHACVAVQSKNCQCKQCHGWQC
jgi:ATP/ADP translocase